jgi:hypothetical protein
MSTAQWTNIGEDAGAPHALLQRVAEHVPPTLVDYIYVFPPRRVATGESTVVVVSAFDHDHRRRVITARFTVARDRRGAATVVPSFAEHGSAPDDAVPRIVLGVLRRLGEDIGAEPREVHVAGEQSRWDDLVIELGGRPAPAAPPGIPAAAHGPATPHPGAASAAPPADDLSSG